ncbi:MAG: zinc-dependent metalloprotease [Thermoflexibacter sp.]|jgi:archaemetzincin|nr:zinc-dependent metalloprotease [Thermoflexibacter sp.]
MIKKILILVFIFLVGGLGYFWFQHNEEIEDINDFIEVIDIEAQKLSHLHFKGRICLVQFGNFPASELALVKRQIVDFYGFSIDTIIKAPLPDSAFYAPRKRYKAVPILNYLNAIRPPNCDKILGLTTKDISTKKGKNEDSGIMGLAYLAGKSCVVSTFRMRKGKVKEAIFRQRLAKVALHEIGHTLGLPHCDKSPTCMLNDAKGSIKTIDREKIELCSFCKKKIDYVKINK